MSWPLPTHDSFRARMERVTHPGNSWCLRCGRPWAIVKEHSTKYADSSACFPLCEDCWQILGSPEARIEYYATLIDKWHELGAPVDEDRKRSIQKAVANGG